MATMTQAQIDAELARKKALGIAPTDAANQKRYDAIPMPGMQTTQQKPATAVPTPAATAQAKPAAPAAQTVPTPADPFAKAGFTSKDHYADSQQQRYDQAISSGDTGLQQRLQDDAKRAGYTLVNRQREDSIPMPADQPAQPAPSTGYQSPVNLYPQLTPEQIKAEADARAAAAIQARTTAANQAKAGIQTSFDRMQANIADDRALENNYNDRQLSPFSGRSDYALGMVERERGRTDRENLQDLQTRLANIDVTLQDFVNATDEQKQAMINEITRQEREYGLQVDGQKYGQWADQRNFGYGQFQDMVGWTGYVPQGGYYPNGGGLSATEAGGPSPFTAEGGGLRTLQGQSVDLQNKQANLDATFGYMDRTGRVLTPQSDWGGLARQAADPSRPLTLAGQAQQDQRSQWQQTFDRAKYESDRGYQFQVQQQAIQNGQWQQQFRLDVERFGFQKASEMWSQSFQEAQASEDNRIRAQQLQQSMTESERAAAQQAYQNVANSGLVVQEVVEDPIDPTKVRPTGKFTVPDVEAFRKYVLSLRLPDAVTDSIFLQYGQGQLVKP